MVERAAIIEVHPQIRVHDLLRTAFSKFRLTRPRQTGRGEGLVRLATGHLLRWRAAITYKPRNDGTGWLWYVGAIHLKFSDREWEQHALRRIQMGWRVECPSCGGWAFHLYWPYPTARFPVPLTDHAVCAKCAGLQAVTAGTRLGRQIRVIRKMIAGGRWDDVAERQSSGVKGAIDTRIALELEGVVPRQIVPSIANARKLEVLEAAEVAECQRT